MKLVRRWGLMTLVALLVLGSMGAALADDTADTEDAKEPLEPGSYVVGWAKDLVAFVLFWGVDKDDVPECESSEGAGADEKVECYPLDVAGPNGQVNHGTMVSSFVHWLKDGGWDGLSEELQDLPKGQLVKRFAHLDFGKGNFDLNGEDGPEAELDEDDGKGPPEWVKAKKAAKAEAKGKKK